MYLYNFNVRTYMSFYKLRICFVHEIFIVNIIRRIRMLIKKLGTIDLPDYVFEDIKTEPNRKKSQVYNPLNRRGDVLTDDYARVTRQEVDNFENYYGNHNCYSVSWKQDHYVNLLPDDFL